MRVGGRSRCLRVSKNSEIQCCQLEASGYSASGKRVWRRRGILSAGESLAYPRDRSQFLGVNSTTREKGIRGIKKGKRRKESGHTYSGGDRGKQI